MKRTLYSRILFMAGLILAFQSITAQKILSEKSRIHINSTIAEVVKTPDIQIMAPEGLIEGVTFKAPKQSIGLGLRILNKTENTKIYINNVEVLPTGAGDIVLKDLDLKKGVNTITLAIREKDKLIKENVFDMVYIPQVTNASPYYLSEGKYYALIIANGTYNVQGITNLKRPVEDAKALKDVLMTKYTFERENISFLPDMNKENIFIALDELQKKITPDDNLLIFYAGHGMMDESSDIGYWLLADAQPGKKYTWFSNGQLIENIKLIKAKHILLLADACYAGSILESRGLSEAPSSIQDLYKVKSRKVLTSGGTTEVSDDSKFAEYLIDILQNNAEQYLSSGDLYSALLKPVKNNSLTAPRWGVIQNVGDMGGDFIFRLRDK